MEIEKNNILDAQGNPISSKNVEPSEDQDPPIKIGADKSEKNPEKSETDEDYKPRFQQPDDPNENSNDNQQGRPKIKTSFFKFEKGHSKHIKKIIIIGVIAIFITLGGAVAARRYLGYTPPKGVEVIPTKLKEDEPKPVLAASALDGVPVDPALANRHPLAVTIENHPDSRPQSGLEAASIIYEAAAEGGITRFMAIFGSKDAEITGPVRSARTYFVNWALEYNAFYAHAGGSVNGLALIASEKVLDLPHANYTNNAYWRQPKTGVSSEHTLFTDTKKLREIADDKNWSSEGDFLKWQFKDDSAEKDRPLTGKVTINFSSATYKVIYDYDPKTNTYARTLGGLPHKDEATGNQLKPKNIVVQKVIRKEVESGGKTVGEITDVGTGEALIFFDGQVIKGSWSKKAEKRRTLFYNEEGTEVKFNPGQTFIEVLDSSSTVDYQISELPKTSSSLDSTTTCSLNAFEDCKD